MFKIILQNNIQIIPRIIGCFIVITVAWISIFIIDTKVRDNWINDVNEISSRASIFTEAWLNKKSAILTPLTKDAYIKNYLTSDDNKNDISVKKAFYTFGYLNNIRNIYLFSSFSPSYITTTVTAQTLPKNDLKELSVFFKSPAMKTSRIVMDKQSKLIHASKIYSNSGLNLGYIAYSEPISSSLKNLKNTLRPTLKKFNLSVYYNNSNGYVALERIHSDNKITAKLITKKQDFPPIFNNANQTGIFNNSLNNKIIASIKQIPNNPNWKISVSRPVSEIPTESTLIRSLIKLITVFIVLFILLIGKKLNNPILKKLITIFSNKSTNIRNKIIIDEPKFKETKHAQHLYAEGTILEKLANQKTEKIPPSEAEIVYTIKTCLRKKQLKFMYQPVIDITTKNIIMHEIYLRMFDENGTMLEPAIIFPTAERNNLLSNIDECVVETAIERHLQNHRLAKPLAINLTGATFESINFLEKLVQNISQKNIQGTKLIFELRSQEIIQDKDAMKFIRNCHKLGCKFSIDYFGGGKNTIEAAKQLKFDYIKVSGLEFNPETATLKKMEELKEIADTCLELQMPLVMEKIETVELIKLCRRLRIPYIQGFKIAKPQSFI